MLMQSETFPIELPLCQMEMPPLVVDLDGTLTPTDTQSRPRKFGQIDK